MPRPPFRRRLPAGLLAAAALGTALGATMGSMPDAAAEPRFDQDAVADELAALAGSNLMGSGRIGQPLNRVLSDPAEPWADRLDQSKRRLDMLEYEFSQDRFAMEREWLHARKATTDATDRARLDRQYRQRLTDLKNDYETDARTVEVIDMRRGLYGNGWLQ